MAIVKSVLVGLVLVLSLSTVAAEPPALPKPTELTFEDQFDRPAKLADLRGAVVILVYGDRKSNELCKTVGESLHVCWHPTAKGQPAAKAQAAPVVPLDGLKPGQESPNVVVIPVAMLRESARSDPEADPLADRQGGSGFGRLARLRRHLERAVWPDCRRTQPRRLRCRRPDADETQRHARPGRDGPSNQDRGGFAARGGSIVDSR